MPMQPSPIAETAGPPRPSCRCGMCAIDSPRFCRRPGRAPRGGPCRDQAGATPILDYHCHLPPADVARNRRFANLFEIWLEGDHYKWRAMRANGVPERFCTGDASPYDKFLAWAATVPHCLRNPLYHWTHLELRRYFGIDVLLNEHTAKEVWDEANRQLASLDVKA